MIVLALQQNGVMEVVSPSRLFQGTDTETILVLSQFPSTVPLSIAFTRPDGSAANEEEVIEGNNTYYAAYHPMLYTPLPSQFEGKGVTAWTYEPNAAWTAQYGNGLISVYAQFPAEVYGDEDSIDNFAHYGRMTSFMAQVTIEETQLPNLPGAPTAEVYSEIIAYLSNYGTQLESLDHRMDTYEGNIEELQHTVYGYEEDGEHVDGLTDRMEDAESDIDSLDSRMGTAERDIDNLETDVSSLQGRMNTAEGNISNLQGRMTTSENKIIEHSGQIDNLETAVGGIRNDLNNYYYTKSQVNSLVDAIPKFNILVVDQLPTTNISTATIYLVPASVTETGNVFTEYIYAENEQGVYQWEVLGSQTIDMSQYSTTAQMNAAIAAAEARAKEYADEKDAETLAAAKAYTNATVGEGEGTIVSVGGVVQRYLSFTSDPQTQIDEKAFSRVYRSITDVNSGFTTSVTMSELCWEMLDGSYLMADITGYTNLLPSGERTGILTIEKVNGEGKTEFIKYPFGESFSPATEKKLRRTFYYDGYFYALFYDENDVGNENKIVKQEAYRTSGDHWTNVVNFPVDISNVTSCSFSGSKCCYTTDDVFIIFDPTVIPAVAPTVITPTENLTNVLYSEGNVFYFGSRRNQSFVVYNTADNTFSYIPYPPNGTPSSAIVINEGPGVNKFLYATTSYGFYKYSISNETWTTIETWNNTHISNLRYNSSNEKIYLFGHNDTREAACRVYDISSATLGSMIYAPFSPNPNVINDIQCTDIVDGRIYCSATVDALVVGGEHNYHSELAIFYVSSERFGNVVAGNPLYDDTSLGIVATSIANNVSSSETDNILIAGTDYYTIFSVTNYGERTPFSGSFKEYSFSGWSNTAAGTTVFVNNTPERGIFFREDPQEQLDQRIESSVYYPDGFVIDQFTSVDEMWDHNGYGTWYDGKNYAKYPAAYASNIANRPETASVDFIVFLEKYSLNIEGQTFYVYEQRYKSENGEWKRIGKCNSSYVMTWGAWSKIMTGEYSHLVELPLYEGQPLTNGTDYYFNHKASIANVDEFLSKLHFGLVGGMIGAIFYIDDTYNGLYAVDMSVAGGTGYLIGSADVDTTDPSDPQFSVQAIHYMSVYDQTNMDIINQYFIPSFTASAAGWQGNDYYHIETGANHVITNLCGYPNADGLKEEAAAFFGGSHSPLWSILSALDPSASINAALTQLNTGTGV